MPGTPPLLMPFDGKTPTVHPDAWVAPGVTVIGDVELAENASVWFGAVLRADDSSIRIGAGSNVQDGCVLHPGGGQPVTLGARVSVGHRAVLHGCTIEDDVLVGMGATVLNGARIGTGSLVAAGAVVREGQQIPPGSLVVGVPATVRREVTAPEAERIRRNAASYLTLTERYRS